MDAKVRDVMTPGPIGVDYYQSIGDAARTMRDWGMGAVLVLLGHALHGLVTDRDLVVRAVAGVARGTRNRRPAGSCDLIGVDADDDTARRGPADARARRPQAPGHRGRPGRGRGIARRPGPARRPVTAEIPAGDITVPVPHAGKVLFPADGITKEDLARYYAAAAGRMLPWLRDRPVTTTAAPRSTSTSCATPTPSSWWPCMASGPAPARR